MRSRSGPQSSAEEHVREIRRQTRKQYGAEEKVRIVLEGSRGEYSIAELCRRECLSGLAGIRKRPESERVLRS